MNNSPFIITITGQTQSGKSIVTKKLELLKDNIDSFYPIKIPKYTTRMLRLEEKNNSSYLDIIPIDEIPKKCDLVYQTYGIRYGIETQILSDKLDNGDFPIIIINDIRAIEELKSRFPKQVLSLFIFRKIPELDDFLKEAKKRGNISESEIYARYEKAISIYRIFIENITLFDKIILNAEEYAPDKLKENNTILDEQLKKIILGVFNKDIFLMEGYPIEKYPKLFIISGNAASGKDEILRAIISIGKMQSIVLPKYAMREQEPSDGDEMICRFIPKKEIINFYDEEYLKEQKIIDTNIEKLDKNFKLLYLDEFTDFEQKVNKKNNSGISRFWSDITIKLKDIDIKERQNIILENFEYNKEYIDLEHIKQYGKEIDNDNNVYIYEYEGKQYIIYGELPKLYACDITNIKEKLANGTKHFVMIASQIGVVNLFKKILGNKRVLLIYAHSEISVEEFESKTTDISKKEKVKKFDEELSKYVNNIEKYDHVTIYAKSKLTYEQTSKEEELIDQMFRLFRVY